jgi:hypothetical protein
VQKNFVLDFKIGFFANKLQLSIGFAMDQTISSQQNFYNYFPIINQNRTVEQISAQSQTHGFNGQQESVPQINANINEVYRLTLGRQPVIIDRQEMIILPLEGRQKISDTYRLFENEVTAFTEKSDIFSSLPMIEMEANLKNWLDVLLLRSCWWFAQQPPDDREPFIRVSGRFVINKSDRKELDPLFSFAETLRDMKMSEFELSLAIAYTLLCGYSSLTNDTNDFGGPNQTSKKQKEVLDLLSKYQKKTYPDDKLRFVNLLLNLTELAYIAGTS